MHWTPPKVRTTPKLRTAYRLLNYLEKRCYVPTGNGKGFWIPPHVEKKVNKLTETISKEQRALQLLETCAEPLCSEMGNSIVTNATRILQFLPLDETNSL